MMRKDGLILGMGQKLTKYNYVYGMKARGFSVGCQPLRGFVEHIEDTTDSFWGILVYSRLLTEIEVRDYELAYLGKVKNNA